MAGTRCALPDPGSAGLQPGRYGPPAPGSAGLQPGLAGLAVSRRALTLLELLVVVGIMLLVAAIGAGVWFNAANTSRLVASERLVAGLVRQARHTARTSGQPVTLLFSKDERTVSGIARVPLWQEWFEGDDNPVIATLVASQPSGPATPAWLSRGRTGQGLIIPAGVDLTAYPIPAIGPDLTRERRLIGRSTLGDGFLLSIAVAVPVAGSGGDIVPLLFISSESVPTGDLPATDQACCGLMLINRSCSAFASGQAPIVGGQPTGLSIAGWDLVGWVQTMSGRTLISAVGNAVRSDGNLESPASPQLSEAEYRSRLRTYGLPGGGWCQFALAWDGHVLHLLVDGRLVAQTTTTNTRLAGGNAMPRIWLGEAQVDHDLRTYASTATDSLGTLARAMRSTPSLGWEVDSLTLSAAGAGQAGQFPQGIAPDGNYAVTCNPDGRITVTGATDNTLKFKGQFDKADSQASIAILSNGSVTSAVTVTP